jgi:hypothetical protein
MKAAVRLVLRSRRAHDLPVLVEVRVGDLHSPAARVALDRVVD